MFSNEEIFGTVFINQIVLGVLGNSFLFYLYIFNFVCVRRGKPIDLILIHLSLINVLLLLFKGIPQTVALLGIRNFLGDIGCKIIVYLDRVFRVLSLCSIGLLSSFQAIIISTNSPVCIVLKARTLRYIILFFILCWILSLLTEGAIPIYMTTLLNSSNFMNNWDAGYCVFSIYATNTYDFILWKSLYDAMWCGLTACNGIYIIFVMLKHHQQVLHIHSTSFLPRMSPEIRATNTILILVSSFISFHLVSSIFFFIYMYSKLSSSWMMHVSAFMTGFFPALCPFVLIRGIARVSRTHFS